MKVTELRERIARGETMILLDVREPEEIAAQPFFAMSPANYLNVPIMPLLFTSKEELEAKIFTPLGYPTTTPIVTLCRSGGRSARACEQLLQHGWQAENLEGGMNEWGK